MVTTWAMRKDFTDMALLRREGSEAERSRRGGGILGIFLEELDWQHSFRCFSSLSSLFPFFHLCIYFFRHLFSFLLEFCSSFLLMFLFFFLFSFLLSYTLLSIFLSPLLVSLSFSPLLLYSCLLKYGWIELNEGYEWTVFVLSIYVWIWVRLASLISYNLTFKGLS